MKSLIAKIGGWAQFGLTLLASLGQQGSPRGWAQWAILVGSLATAVGVHASASTDGTK